MIVRIFRNLGTFLRGRDGYTRDDSCCTAAFVQRWRRKGEIWAHITIITANRGTTATAILTVIPTVMAIPMPIRGPPTGLPSPSR